MYAEVLPNAPITSAFHYAIPAELEGRLQAGHLVQIPFGRQLLQGLVVGLSDELPGGLGEADLKPIDSLLDSQPVLSRDQIDLGYYLAGRYLAPLPECLFLMLPPGLGKQGDSEYDLADYAYEAQNETQARLIDLLRKRGALRGRQLERAMPRRNWKPAAAALVRQGVLTRRAVLAAPSARPKQIRTARLTVPTGQMPAVLFGLRASPQAADVLDYLFSLWPGQPALPDLLSILGLERAALEPLLSAGWLRLTSAQPVVEAGAPAEALRNWIARRAKAEPEAARLLEALCEKPVAPLSELLALFEDLPDLLDRLEEQGLARQRVNPACVVLNLTGAEVAANSARLRKPSKRADVLAYLARQTGPVPVSWIYAETGATAAHLKELAERDLVDLGQEELLRDPLAGKVFAPAEPPRLTRDQEAAWEAIGSAFNLAAAAGMPPPPFLLHGVTGSGKTEIYLRAAAQALALGRRALVLVPEIALTPQTVQRFASRFPGRVAVLHSQLSPGERYDTWRRCRAGAVDVVVGARSALFTPLPDLGLIILDEEHDEAYQQDPPLSPYYHARDVAVEYARRLNAVCLLGSATPDLISYFKAQRGDYRLLELPQRVLAHSEYLDSLADQWVRPGVYHPLEDGQAPAARYADLPAATIVDMRNELRAGNRSLFSRALQAALAETLGRGEQVILFLNRRGQSTFVFCRDCGFVLACARCGTPLTYHGEAASLQCHHCGASRRQPAACPQCRSSRIKFFGAGTELVEAELRKLQPQARPLRWDRDTTRERGAHEIILDHFRQGRADVLIGTQMVAKGLDLPLVTLVGVVSADVGLNLPDYRSAERVFQVLAQVAGRAGRSALGGRVIIQSYQPDHYAILSAARHDYAEFYEREMAQRKKLAYPPYARLVRLTYRSTHADKAETEARRAAALIEARLKAREARATVLIGPAPCFFERINGEYRWQIVLRGPRPAEALKDLPLKDWQVEVDPMSLL